MRTRVAGLLLCLLLELQRLRSVQGTPGLRNEAWCFSLKPPLSVKGRTDRPMLCWLSMLWSLLSWVAEPLILSNESGWG